MKHSIRVLSASVLLALATISVFAGGRSSGYSSSKTVHVTGYYRKDGTYVHAYDRAAPGTASRSASAASSFGASAIKSSSAYVPNTSSAVTTAAVVPAPTPDLRSSTQRVQDAIAAG